jgi:hypothetical protein
MGKQKGEPVLLVTWLLILNREVAWLSVVPLTELKARDPAVLFHDQKF